MKNKLYKVKRKHVDWNLVRLDLNDPAVDSRYFKFLATHPRMSKNRIAFYALKHYYSTTAIKRYRISGDLNELLSSHPRCGLRFESVE